MPTLIRNKVFKAFSTTQNGQNDWTGYKIVGTPSVTSYDFFENRSGQTNPNWRRMVKEGVQAGTPYSFDGCRIASAEGGSVTLTITIPNTNPQNWTTYWKNVSDAGIANTPTHAATDVIKADNQALTRLRFKVRDQSEHFNALITLAEGRMAVSQLRKPYAAIQQSIDSYVERASKGLRGLPRMSRRRFIDKANDILAQSWLETTFGLAPTLSDVVSASESLARLYGDGTERRSSVKGFYAVDRAVNSTTYDLWDAQVYYRSIQSTYTQVIVAYRAGIRERRYSSFSGWERLGDLAGFRLGNFVPTIYELVPYSWLNDYVTTLGEAITANQVDLTDVSWVVRSELSRTTWTHNKSVDSGKTMAHYAPNMCSISGSSLGKTAIRRTTSSRSLISPSQLPAVLPRVRSLSEAFTPKRAANVLAVVYGKVRKLESVINLLRK